MKAFMRLMTVILGAIVAVIMFAGLYSLGAPVR